MLTFRNLNILFINLLIPTIGFGVTYGIGWYIYPVLLLAYSLWLFYGCYYVGSGMFIPIICSATTDEKVIAISFDDGPDGDKTSQILQILKNESIKAAFFCIGNRINGNEAILKNINDEGHLIGNHTFSHHYWFDIFSAKKMQDDMLAMDKLTSGVTGKTPKLFRPPYGVTNPNVKKAIITNGYIPVGWSVRSMDTVIKNEQKLLNKVKKGLKPGAVFLFHDTSITTLAILPEFIKFAKAQGYGIIRLDKMLNLQAYA